MKTGNAASPPAGHARLMAPFDTARLHLRPIGEADEALYCHLYTDPDLMQHIAPPITMEAARRSFAMALRQQSWARQRWILVDQAATARTGVGLLGLFLDAGEAAGRCAEIGVMLLPAWQGRGFAAEAIAAMAERVFLASHVDALWTRHAPRNALATGLMHKLRFVPEDMPGDASQRRWTLTRARWAQLRDPGPGLATPTLAKHGGRQ